MPLHHCSFSYMKSHGHLAAPFGGRLWDGGATTFINKGTNGRWRDLLDTRACEAYESIATAQLGADCATWLAHGGDADITLRALNSSNSLRSRFSERIGASR